MFDDYDYGDTLSITLKDGSVISGVFCGVDDADETPLGVDEVDIDDGRVTHGISAGDIASIERVS